MLSTKVLIVNADDFNSNADRCRGILDAATHGIVSSTTVLSNLELTPTIIEELKAVLQGAVGVHLNVTYGKPLCSDTSSLCDAGGNFYPKPLAWRRALLRGFRLPEVEREFAAQIEALQAAGIQPSHIDSNNHLHVFPGFPEIICRLAKRYGIERVRVPAESTLARKPLFLKLLSRSARRCFSNAGLRTTRHFAGVSFPNCGSSDSMLQFLRTLPEGSTELMCHPGLFPENGSSFSTPDRLEEHAVLMDEKVKDTVAQAGIRLTSFLAL